MNGGQEDAQHRDSGLNSLALSPSKWAQATGAIGIFAKARRGGGTYAHVVKNWHRRGSSERVKLRTQVTGQSQLLAAWRLNSPLLPHENAKTADP